VATLTPATGALALLMDDRLGTPQLASNASQSTVWATNYQPYGLTGTITGSITQNLRLPGQYADAENEFNHNGYRGYAPSTGRYIESDPIGLAGGMNTYVYARANPAKTLTQQGHKRPTRFRIIAYGR
jgi:RHS repeat-associated protein